MSGSVGPVVAALIGAGGAVVGGGLTAGTTILSDRLKHRRERNEAATAERRALRKALRLVSSELQSSLVVFEAAAERPDDWRGRPASLLPIEQWGEHRALLADALSDDAWNAVMQTYRTLELLQIGDASILADDETNKLGTKNIQATLSRLASHADGP